MSSNDILNGFTGFANRKPGFIPASFAMNRPTSSDGSVPMASASTAPREAAATSAVREAPIMRFTTGEPVEEGASASFDPEKLEKIPDTDRRWSWVNIDLNAIRHNVIEVKRRLDHGTHLMAIVKADAYGHGAVRVAKMALNSGADYLGVATVQEAIELREGMVNAPVLILAQPPASAIPLLLAYKIMPAVYSPEFAIQYAEAADALGLKAPYHLAVNSGMNRIGVRYDEVIPFLTQVGFHRALDLVGTFTHFATADCPETLDFRIQTKRFVEAIESMRAAGVNPGIVHCANSAAAIRYPDVQFDMIRLGISLYGFHPCSETRTLIDLHPAMSVHTRITDSRLVPMSDGVSYGMHYRSPGSVRICTVPIGYADGLRRDLSSKTDFIVKGQRFHQVGNICMDQCMFEVDLRSRGARRLVDPQVGDEVTVVGRDGDSIITIDDMANICNTIPHEICIGFGTSRMPRYYS